jgi:pimeloyl-ACP methyl ester carboxylesterase
VNAVWMDTTPGLGQAGRVSETRALCSRPGVSFVATSGGRLRIRRAPCPRGPRLLIATDAPNVIEHYDELLRELEGRADVAIFEPPGTGASAPARGYDFTLPRLTEACGEVLEALGPRTLVFPCYLGFVAQALARQQTALITRAVLPQTSSWADLLRWAEGVDKRRLIRAPFVGQALLTLGRRRIAQTWYAASTSERRFRQPFAAAADEAFNLGGCFCLASLMQGFARAPPPEAVQLPVPTAIVWGSKDRTHRGSDPAHSVPCAEVVVFEGCGHSPDLEAPREFSKWLLTWHEGSQ